jgi:hypothetical protein
VKLPATFRELPGLFSVTLVLLLVNASAGRSAEQAINCDCSKAPPKEALNGCSMLIRHFAYLARRLNSPSILSITKYFITKPGANGQRYQGNPFDEGKFVYLGAGPEGRVSLSWLAERGGKTTNSAVTALCKYADSGKYFGPGKRHSIRFYGSPGSNKFADILSLRRRCKVL